MNNAKMILLLGLFIATTHLQAMTHQRMECGFVHIDVYENLIVAYNGHKQPLGLLCYFVHKTPSKLLEIKSMTIDERYQSNELELRLVKAASLRAGVLGSDILVTGFDEHVKKYLKNLGFKQKDSTISLFYKTVLKSRL